MLLSIPISCVALLAWPGLAFAEWTSVTTLQTSARVYVPQTHSPIGVGRGLLVGLHGCLQTASDLEMLGNLETSAEALGVVLALPDAPFGGVIAGCWDYYGTDHTRHTRHNGAILSLTESLLEDDALEIDPDQVYVAGLSSGGGEAVVIGCLAPEVFAGVGVIAGPALGTQASEIASVATTVRAAATSCSTLAGPEAPALQTQLAVAYASSGDFVVAQGYAELNAQMYTELYDAEVGEGFDLQGAPGYQPAGEGLFFDDPAGHRVAWLFAQGQGHAWPAGSGPGPELSYVATEGVDFARFALEFFVDNNRRVDVPPGGEGGDAGGGTDSTGGSDGDAEGTDGETDGGTGGGSNASSSDGVASEDACESGEPIATGDTGSGTDGSPATGDGGGCRVGSPVWPPSPLMLLPFFYFFTVSRQRPKGRPNRDDD